jgi:hypothetical protein
MNEVTRRTFLRLGLGAGLASLAAIELPALLEQQAGEAIIMGRRQLAALERAIRGGQVESVPLQLHYLGTVQPQQAQSAPVYYHVYQTTTATSNQEHGALYFLATGEPTVKPTALAAPLHPHVPGQLTLQIQPFAADDTRYQRQLPDGNVLLNGAALADLQKLFGGLHGQVVDPALGKSHIIDLSSWAHADPSRTYLNIAFYFRPDQDSRHG